jgi:hypothetical protein
MTPLDIVNVKAGELDIATLRSQRMSLGAYLYLFAEDLRNLRACPQRGAVRQAGQNRPVWTLNNEWRTRCPRASSHSWQSALLPWLLPVAKTSRWKNMLWSTQSRSRLSRPTPANTSKASRLTGGQAMRPVHTRATSSQIRRAVA